MKVQKFKEKMGILALVDFHLVEEICEKLKASKGTFSGKFKDDGGTPVKEGGALETLKYELLKAKKGSRKRKRESGKKAKNKSPIRFCQNESSESDSESEPESSITGKSGDSDSSTASSSESSREPENKFARLGGAQRFNESSEESHTE